jgi:hypothetical protein
VGALRGDPVVAVTVACVGTLRDLQDVWRRFTFGGSWTRSKPQTFLTLVTHALVRPGVTIHIWRHRNDPPPPKAPPVAVRDFSREDEP